MLLRTGFRTFTANITIIRQKIRKYVICKVLHIKVRIVSYIRDRPGHTFRNWVESTKFVRLRYYKSKMDFSPSGCHRGVKWIDQRHCPIYFRSSMFENIEIWVSEALKEIINFISLIKSFTMIVENKNCISVLR